MKTRVLLVLIGLSLFAFSCDPVKKLTRTKKKYLHRTAATIRSSVSGTDVELRNDTIKVTFKNVMFAFNEAAILPSYHASFEQLAKALNEYVKTQVIVSGHTDSIGGDNEANMALSKSRADSAKNLLIYYHVSPSRVTSWSFGAKEPIATNSTEEGRAKNRRIEVVILYDEEKKEQ